MSGRSLGKPRDAGDRGGFEVCSGKCGANVSRQSAEREAGKMRSKTLYWRSAEQTSLASCLGPTRSAVVSLEERRSEVKRLLHEVQGRRPCANVCGDHQEAPAVSLW